jgi:tetratricopeptide (TPR) repeat protein
MNPTVSLDPSTLSLAANAAQQTGAHDNVATPLAPSDQAALDSLLALWDDARQRGLLLHAEQLVAEQPHLLEPLDDALRQRRATLGLAAPTPPVSAAPPGYRLLGELGRGGMGVVYRAHQTALHRTVALKMIKAGADASSEQLTRFLQEAETIAKLVHPHIVPVYEFGTHEERPFFALEFCAGGSLEKRIRDEPQEPEFAARIVEQLADALAAVHALGIIHRDLKPDNVLLTEEGVPKVTDFGLARQGDVGMTQTGQVMGTPAYMAPEQARGDTHHLGPAADIWALGAILYRLLTGRVPFKAAGIPATLKLVTDADPVPIRQLIPGCPRDLETITLKCLSKEPGKRYASAVALRDDLRAWREGRPISARPVGVVERAWKWAKRNRAAAALIAVLAVGITGVTLALRQARANKRLAEANAAEAIKGRDLAKSAIDQITGDDSQDRLTTAEKLSERDKAMLRKAMTLYAQLAQQSGDTPQAKAMQANGYFKVAWIQAKLGESNDAIGNYRAALDLQAALAKDFPTVPGYRQELAPSHNNLGFLLRDSGDAAGARQNYLAALDLQAALAKDFPTVIDYAIGLGRTQCNIGHWLSDRREFAEAVESHTAAIATLSGVLKRQPSQTTAQQLLWKAHQGRATALNALGRHAESLADWQRAAELGSWQYRAFFRRKEADAWARAGQADKALPLVEAALKGKLDADDRYDMACVLALCAAATKDEALAGRAVSELRKAWAAGYRDLPHIEQNSDWAGLRTREDYRAWLAEARAEWREVLRVKPRGVAE